MSGLPTFISQPPCKVRCKPGFADEKNGDKKAKAGKPVHGEFMEW
jgi:hypothetical protein